MTAAVCAEVLSMQLMPKKKANVNTAMSAVPRWIQATSSPASTTTDTHKKREIRGLPLISFFFHISCKIAHPFV